MGFSLGDLNPKKWGKKGTDEIKKALNKVIDEANRGLHKIDSAVNIGMYEVNKAKDSGKYWVSKRKNDALKELDVFKDKAIDELEYEAKEALEKAKEAAEKASQEISSQGIKKSLETAADVIELVSPDKFGLILGIELALVVQGEVTIRVGFPNPVAKLTEIRKWAKHPPKGRSKIIECVKDFGPDSISVEAKVSGNGMDAEWSGDSKYDKLDKFLEKHGV